MRNKANPETGDLLIDFPDNIEIANPGLYPNHRVYHYDNAKNELTERPWSDWQNATTQSVENEARCSWRPTWRQELDPQIIQRIETVGKNTLCLFRSPRPGLIAVISANGRFVPGHGGGMFFAPGASLGRGGSKPDSATGQYFVEFFQLPDVRKIGKPIRVAARVIGRGPWSSDAKYFLLTDEERFYVIPVDEFTKE